MKHFFLLLLCGLALVFFQAIPWGYLTPHAGTLNLSLVFVVVLALYRPTMDSWFLVFLVGYALEVLSGMSGGLLPLQYLATFFIIRVLSRVVLFDGVLSQAFLVFFLGFLADLLFLATTHVPPLYPLGVVLQRVLLRDLLLAFLSTPLLASLNKKACAQRVALKQSV